MKVVSGTILLLMGLLVSTFAVANEQLQYLSESPDLWVMYGRDYANTRYSPLAQINRYNVQQLHLAYALQLGTLRSQESVPLVIGSTLYVTSSWSFYVYALDAATGVLKWKYAPEVPEDVAQYACCDVVNRGVAYAAGKIFFGRLDGYLVALEANTGAELWAQQVIDYKQGAVITSPPLVVKNLVVIGYGGGEYGARGSLTAYDLETGKQMWRTYTTPGPGEPGNETWKGDSWKHGGGAAWYVGSYDANFNLIYYGTSNPGPWNAAVRGPGTSNYGQFTNLYTSSTIALDADTGKIVWYYQSTPHDAWDYDGVNEAVLVDLTINGKPVPALLHADRNGFFYVLNRQTGALISAEPFVYVNWATGIDMQSGRPIEVAAKRPRIDHQAKDVCPHLLGGKNFPPMAYHPGTGLVYIPSMNLCMDLEDKEINYTRGLFYLGKEFGTKVGPGGHMAEIMAWNPVKQAKVWGVKEKLPLPGGLLTTGGDLVFYGNGEGWFKALDAKEGRVLWQFNTGSGIIAAPMTFSVNGKQHVAIVSGRTVAIPPFLAELGAQYSNQTPEGGTLFVFSQ
jgi:alcohol dehydrogenase (cytochrome c)